jgi:hypothetical protein
MPSSPKSLTDLILEEISSPSPLRKDLEKALERVVKAQFCEEPQDLPQLPDLPEWI